VGTLNPSWVAASRTKLAVKRARWFTFEENVDI
jgi:hypothetical protein